MRRFLISFSPLFAAIPFLAAAGCGASTDTPSPSPLVRTILVTDPVVETGRSFAGTVHAQVETDLGFRVGGKIAERLVSAGSHVRRGQILMRLDAADYDLAANAAAADLAAALARSSNAETELRRVQRLLEHDAVSRSQAERVEADARAAAERVRAASAQARSAANRSTYANLVAGADGIVTEISAETGQVVAAGQPVLRLASDGPRDVEISLPEQYGALAVGFPASVTFLSSDKPIAASLRVMAGSADPVARTYRARFAVSTDEPQILGATARVNFAAGDGQAGFEVPLSAIHDVGQGPGVWVVDTQASKVRWRAVTIGGYSEDKVRIVDGLRSGDRVVTLGAHILANDQAVRIAPAAGQAVASKAN